ncbi:hypothetical protein BH10ACT1_BH10ACT1_28990 [soil metagenome]
MIAARPYLCRSLGAVALACAVVVGLAGCGKDEFADKTARVTIGGRTTTYTVDSCGLDDRTAFIVGRTDGGSVLQAVVGVQADRKTGVADSTGLSVIDDGVELAAFGDESWERRSMTGPAPGAVTSSKIRGSRIQAAGKVVAVAADGTITSPSDEGSAFTLDARCDAAEQD